MHPVRMLLDLMPVVLVELGGISWTGSAFAVIPVDRRFAGSANGAEEAAVREQHGAVSLPHHSQLFEDMSKGSQSCKGHCRDQEEHGFCMMTELCVETAVADHMGFEALLRCI